MIMPPITVTEFQSHVCEAGRCGVNWSETLDQYTFAQFCGGTITLSTELTAESLAQTAESQRILGYHQLVEDCEAEAGPRRHLTPNWCLNCGGPNYIGYDLCGVCRDSDTIETVIAR